jgi:hypothetical protein
MALALGCGPTDTTGGGPTSPTAGSITLNYRIGASTTAFSASGEMKLNTDFQLANVSMATAFSTDSSSSGYVDYHRVLGQRASGGKTEIVSLVFHDMVDGGPMPIAPPVPQDQCSVYCTGLTLLIGRPASDPSITSMNYDFVCRLTSGAAKGAVNKERLQGTFSGQGTCTNYSTGAEEPFEVSNGSFELPTSTRDAPLNIQRVFAPYAIMPSGQLSFNFSNGSGSSGTYNAQGAQKLVIQNQLVTYSYDGTWAHEFGYAVTSRVQLDPTNSSGFYIDLFKRTTGNTFPLYTYDACPSNQNCAVWDGRLYVLSGGRLVEHSCTASIVIGDIERGTVQLGSVSKTRFRGTFSYQDSVCIITGGFFDVPISESYMRPL